MSALLLTNATLAGARSHTPELPLSGLQLNELPQFTDQYLLIEDGLIAAYGPMSEAPTGQIPVRDVRGRFVLPAWCDSHTHLVYAASREQEFEMRLHGRTYEEIAAAGGGIINSAMMLRAMDESELYDRSDLSRYSDKGRVLSRSRAGMDWMKQVNSKCYESSAGSRKPMRFRSRPLFWVLMPSRQSTSRTGVDTLD